jgi:hypothetical protein
VLAGVPGEAGALRGENAEADVLRGLRRVEPDRDLLAGGWARRRPSGRLAVADQVRQVGASPVAVARLDDEARFRGMFTGRSRTRPGFSSAVTRASPKPFPRATNR